MSSITDPNGLGWVLGGDGKYTWTGSGIAAWEKNGTSVYYDGGNVGVGTSAPAYALDVVGTIKGDSTLLLNSATTSSFMQASTNAFQMGTSSSAPLITYTDNTERMRIDATGLVGIGTDTPQGVLHLNSGFSSALVAQRTNNKIALEMTSLTSGGYGFYDINAAQYDLYMKNGSVGIGTTNPSTGAKLHLHEHQTARLYMTSEQNAIQIIGAPVTTGMFIDNESDTASEIAFRNTSAYIERMRIDANGNVGIGTTSPFSTARLQVRTGTDRNLAIQTGTSETSGMKINAFNDAANTNIPLELNGSATLLKTNETERMRIDSLGNVGIGGSISTAKLYVVGATNDSTQLALRAQNLATSDVFFVRNDGSMVAGIGSKMTLDASGNLGIGTTNPTFSSGSYGGLHIHQASGTALRLTNTVSGQTASDGSEILLDPTTADTLYVNRDSAAQRFYTGGAERMRIDSSGNVIAGGTSAQAANAVTLMSDGEVTAAGFYFSNNIGSAMNDTGIRRATTSTMVFDTGSTERMRIDSSGNVLVGRTNGITFSANSNDGVVLQPNRLDVSAASVARITQIRDSSGTLDRFYNGASIVGSITCNTTATAYNTSSDRRLKENIVDAPSGNIDALRVRSFDWKADGSHQKHGFVAQELAEVAPEAVSKGETEDDMWGVDYSKLVPLIVKAIQELKAEVDSLKQV